jgi:2-iminobutanoate/2-iminopropanoate deaminase
VSLRTAVLISVVVLAPGVFSMQERRVIVDSSQPSGSAAVVAGGLVYVSSIRGTAAGDDTVTDVQTETRRVLDRMKAVLESAGSSLEQTVAINVYLKRGSDFDAMNAAYREYFPKDPPTRTTVVTGLTGGALVEASAIAVPNGAAREALHPPGWAKSPRPYSTIIRAGGLVFLSGLVSRRGSDDRIVPGPIPVQTKTILDSAGVLLKTAGVGFEDVVLARVFLSDDSYFEAMNDEYRKYFSTEPPARATAITGLVGGELTVEITLVASQTKKEAIGPLLSPTLPVSTAIRAGNRIFLSGVVGNTDANRDDAGAQARESLTRLGVSLEAAGASFSDVVDSTVYVPNLADQGKVSAALQEVFPADPPARAMVGAGLVARDSRVEVLLTAVK